MALAALFLLKRIQRALAKDIVQVKLVEGFVSQNDPRKHHEVAAALRDAFLGKSPGKWYQVERENSDEVISVLDLLDPAQPSMPPIILEPPGSTTKSQLLMHP